MSANGKLRIIVTGMVGQYPLGGVAWDYCHYLIGLHALGHDVYYHEDTWCWPLNPQIGYPVDDPAFSVAFLRDFFERYAPQLADRWHYLFLHEKSFGMMREKFEEVARTADIFLNVSGACFVPENLNPRCVKVFLDTDPGYNQIMLSEKFAWSENVERWVQQVRSHDRHLTYAENIWGDDCILPHVGLDWRPTRCVVTLADWKKLKDAPPPANAVFTTVMSWSYWKGKLLYKGVEYGAKAPEYDKFHDLPRRVNVPLTLAVAGHHKPTEQIVRDGWKLVEGWAKTQKTDDYMQFIADSLGEWSVAKNCYVATNSGWFSCRTACYLAAGRPAVVQDTKWSKFVPSGAGVVAFDTMQQSIDALTRVASDAAKHRAAAYEVAREYLAHDRVLPPMIDAIFASERARGPIPPSRSSP
jgi:hypothetical protein